MTIEVATKLAFYDGTTLPDDIGGAAEPMPKLLPNNTDLDTVRDPGWYGAHIGVFAITNAPSGVEGLILLFVEGSITHGFGTKQTLTETMTASAQPGGTSYTRTFTVGGPIPGWTHWAEIVTQRVGIIPSQAPADLNNYITAGFYACPVHNPLPAQRIGNLPDGLAVYRTPPPFPPVVYAIPFVMLVESGADTNLEEIDDGTGTMIEVPQLVSQTITAIPTQPGTDIPPGTVFTRVCSRGEWSVWRTAAGSSDTIEADYIYSLNNGGNPMQLNAASFGIWTQNSAGIELDDQSGDGDAHLWAKHGGTIRLYNPIDMYAQPIKDLADPVDPQDAVTKSSVEALLSGVSGGAYFNANPPPSALTGMMWATPAAQLFVYTGTTWLRLTPTTSDWDTGSLRWDDATILWS